MKKNIPELYGSLVFNDSEMKARLPKDIYKALAKTINSGSHLELDVANSVAVAMKEWALEHGATHFTHWFQPMTGITAEKHDSFLSPTGVGEAIMEFSGKELVKGEPDASSFPSGGLRATFEARGYTAWDPTSFAFIKGHTLCIPTAFCSYSGEALDKKTPLLRSMEAVSKEATHLLHILGKTDVKRVNTTVGAEQEYFLVDKECYRLRKDLIFCRRTLFGAPAPKGQEMDDHYFGSIKPRVEAFMEELNEELWKLGIPAKTEHNEVAPAQHELAPVFETVNVAVDHNQLVMEMMKKVADRHDLACLLHEKPFEGINGSGKHNNWALSTDTGENLLNPGKTPAENTQFLLFLAAVVEAVDDYADLLRISVATAGNDHRLGANEAPPAIISIFLGAQLEDVLKQLISTGEATHSIEGEMLKTGVATLPDFMKDATDRNRTSPFAFTGNKFEFRMVGSKASIAQPNVVLNTIVAEAFAEVCDTLEKADDFDMAVHDLIKKNVTEHQRIVFNGNGYSDGWVEEAERRGLPNIRSMVDAIPYLATDKSVALFERFGVFTRAELESRVEVEYETYAKTINIEAKAMMNIAGKQIIPAVIKYATSLATSVNAVTAACGADVSVQTELLTETSTLLAEAQTALKKLHEVTEKAAAIEEGRVQAVAYRDEVKVAMDELRAPIDKLEMIVDKDVWPMPSYGDLIFEV